MLYDLLVSSFRIYDITETEEDKSKGHIFFLYIKKNKLKIMRIASLS